MYPLYRVEQYGHSRRVVKVGEVKTLGEARAFLAKQSNAGHAGVFFEYPQSPGSPIPDRHAGKRGQVRRAQSFTEMHDFQAAGKGQIALAAGGAS